MSHRVALRGWRAGGRTMEPTAATTPTARATICTHFPTVTRVFWLPNTRVPAEEQVPAELVVFAMRQGLTIPDDAG